MGLLSRITGRGRRRPAGEDARPAEAAPATGFGSRLGNGWPEDDADGEDRDRRGHGMNYLVIDQFGTGSGGGGIG